MVENHDAIKENINKRNKRRKNTKKEDQVKLVFDFWNSQKIIAHRELTPDMRRSIKTKLGFYTQAEICQAIINYSNILHSDRYVLRYKWTLREFLQRSFDKFIDFKSASQNYSKAVYDGKGKRHRPGQPKERGQYTRPEDFRASKLRGEYISPEDYHPGS